jgi:serine phosphatase RsbU (regulator of sigma subunit)
MATESPPPPRPGSHFLQSMARALVDEKTYDVRKNPSLWVGFLLAIPIPLITFSVEAPLALRLLTLPAPVFWGILLGAAGQVGILAKQQQMRLEAQVRLAAAEQERTTAILDVEVERRQELEVEKEEVVSELKLAQAIQRTLIPPPIQRPDCEVVSRVIPTRFIGGDYVHSNVVDGRWLYLVLMDVSGHGISAAMVVARLHGMIRRLTLTGKRPVYLLEILNRAALQLLQHTYFFMTAAVARIDLEHGELEYATAGHPAQLLLRHDGSTEELRTRNRLLGMDDDIFDQTEPSKRVLLQPGDSIILFTDGLYEVLAGGDGEILGEDELRSRISALGGLPPQLLIGEILQELSDFQGSSDFDDDLTLLVARYLGRDPEAPPQS